MNTFGDWCEVSPIGDLLVRGARLEPERDVIVLPGERYTYSDLLERATRVARGLWGLGVRHGDKVGLLATNGIEFVEALFGVQLLGGLIVPLNARHKAAELGYIIDNGDLTALLTTGGADQYVDFSEVLTEALPALRDASDPSRLELHDAPQLRIAVLLRGEGKPGFMDRAEFERVIDDTDAGIIEAARRRVRVRDTAAIIYTSGTTAHPKGCMLSHEAMTRGAVERSRVRLAGGPQSVTWGSGPLFHIGSLAPFLGSIGAVGTYLTDVFFEPGRALELMEQEGVTNAWPWFPAIMQGLLDHPSFDPAKLSTLRSMLLIGPPALHARVQAAFPKMELVQACGMTETAGIYAISDEDEPAELRCEAQGRPCPGVEVRIIDPDTGKDLPPGEVGEILVRGYCVMDGYYRDPEKTAHALDSERWLHTGDLYCQSADGRLMFHGRLKDMLKVGGENVAALEVEAFLAEHPAVKLVEVVGAPDERLDEVPVAFVEVRPGHTLQAEQLIQFCKGRIANYKVPRAVHFVEPDQWPMSATKVDKRQLRARLAELSQAGVG